MFIVIVMISQKLQGLLLKGKFFMFMLKKLFMRVGIVIRMVVMVSILIIWLMLLLMMLVKVLVMLVKMLLVIDVILMVCKFLISMLLSSLEFFLYILKMWLCLICFIIVLLVLRLVMKYIRFFLSLSRLSSLWLWVVFFILFLMVFICLLIWCMLIRNCWVLWRNSCNVRWFFLIVLIWCISLFIMFLMIGFFLSEQIVIRQWLVCKIFSGIVLQGMLLFLVRWQFVCMMISSCLFLCLKCECLLGLSGYLRQLSFRFVLWFMWVSFLVVGVVVLIQQLFMQWLVMVSLLLMEWQQVSMGCFLCLDGCGVWGFFGGVG